MGSRGFMCGTSLPEQYKVTDTFRDKKSQQQNLNCIDEAVRDDPLEYGLQAVHISRESDHFPSAASLASHYKVHGNSYDLASRALKEWMAN